MTKKIVPVIFIIVISILAVIFIQRKYFSKTEEKIASPRVVTPQVSQSDSKATGMDTTTSHDVAVTSLIQLNSDETLIGTETLDFDGDGFEDQVNAVKTSSGPTLFLVIGLYNPEKLIYERVSTVETAVTQVKTFLFTGMDLTGDHRTALVYQGFTDSGSSVLQAFFVNRNPDGSVDLHQIANLESDGSIFIQQVDRSEAYIRSQADGESFSIWVYSSDLTRPNSTDQIHVRYKWDKASQSYIEAERQHVTGSRIAARELSRIQDGTVGTFAEFLNGLWYKTENRGERMYLSFDWEGRQIVFSQGENQEVYDWQNSSVRRNGMYISSTNLEIQNLQRRIDISLRNVDEIRISLHEDVRMLINEQSEWNGDYKKISSSAMSAANNVEVEPEVKKYVEDLIAGPEWKTTEGTIVRFGKEQYVAFNDTMNDNGVFTGMDSNGLSFLQFRSNTDEPVFRRMYLVSYAAGKDGTPGADKETVILQPYVVSPSQAYPAEERMVILNRYDPEKDPKNNVVELEFNTTGNGPQVKVESSANPFAGRYFSPDNDGNEDVLSLKLECESKARIKSWSLVVHDSRSDAVFWRTSGSAMSQVSGKPSQYTLTVNWDGRGLAGQTVTSAEDYPYEFTVVDEKGLTSTYSSVIPVDVMVAREAGRLKMQIPSIVFRGDAADFRLVGDLEEDGSLVIRSSLSREQKANNERILARVAQILTKFSSYKVTIVGHANPMSQYTGIEMNNPEEIKDGVWGRALIPLSKERAQYVKDWLVREGGISAGRLSVEGKGGLETIVDKNDLVNRWRNRRVEFILER